MPAQPMPFKQQIDDDPKQYLELWKWFTDDASKIKDKMWIMCSFFFTVLGALLGFAGKQLDSFAPFSPKEPVLLSLVALMGCILSVYGLYMIQAYGKHIQSSWDRANYLRRYIGGLSEIWYAGLRRGYKKKSALRKTAAQGMPMVAFRLMLLMAIFLFLYLGLLVMVLKS
ncbi:MAG: RipA family octameric membrane protein [Aurantibacter sp.]